MHGGAHRGPCVKDLNGDVKPDLIFPGEWGSEQVIYVNNLDFGDSPLAFTLKGTTSNHAGVGAKLFITTPDGEMIDTSLLEMGGTTRCLPDPVVWSTNCADLLNLQGCHDTVNVTVVWPSGNVSEYNGLSAGERHELEEKWVMSLPVAGPDVATTRFAPADGVSEISFLINAANFTQWETGFERRRTGTNRGYTSLSWHWRPSRPGIGG